MLPVVLRLLPPDAIAAFCCTCARSTTQNKIHGGST
jgi:hypothetical protein